MNKDDIIDYSDAVCKVKGYRHTMLKLTGIIFIFLSVLAIGTTYAQKSNVEGQTFILICVAFGVVAVLSFALVIYDGVSAYKIKNKDCVILFENGITVFVDKPKTDKGYKHFSFDELQDYGFINIIRKDSSETRLTFSEKRPSSDTYLFADLMNYGYMRITTKDGGYYNVSVGDIQTVRDFLKEHTQIDEFIYIRIAGIHDDIVINSK